VTKRPALPYVLAGTVAAGAVLDLYALLLLPLRVSGHLVPVGSLVALAGNAALGTAANRLAGERTPAQVLLGLVVILSAIAVARGPGGDVIVTRDLEGMYLVFVIAACFGAAAPLMRRSR
jgi:hypothetical protein